MLSDADNNVRMRRKRRRWHSFIAQPSTATIFPASLLPPMADILHLFIGPNDANPEPTVGHLRNAEGLKLVSSIRVKGELIAIIHLRYSRSSLIMSQKDPQSSQNKFDLILIGFSHCSAILHSLK